MSLHRVLRAVSLCLICWWAAPLMALAASAAPPTGAGLRLQTDVSYTANLVHWVDNLAGTSAGKTMPAYRAAWRDRFGPYTEADREALRVFASLRSAAVPSGARVENEAGCLPVESDIMSWHQRFLAEAMQAGSVEDLAQALYPGASDQRALLVSSLAHFASWTWPACCVSNGPICRTRIVKTWKLLKPKDCPLPC